MSLATTVRKTITSALPHLPDAFLNKVASRYIAGEAISDALFTALWFEGHGVQSTINLLGEHLESAFLAKSEAKEYHTLIAEIGKHHVSSHISVKLSQLGLGPDGERYAECRVLLENILKEADGAFVRIDMEDSRYTDNTLRMWKELHQAYKNVGFVLQARLKRSKKDVESVLHLKPNVRICKGIYLEKENAFQSMEEINRNYMELVYTLQGHHCYIAIATHDKKLIEHVKTSRYPKELYEFQMLLGVDDAGLISLARAGHKARVYIPYGEWGQRAKPYALRRMKENPKVAWYVVKNMFDGR